MDLNIYHANLEKNPKYVGRLRSIEMIDNLPLRAEGDIYSTEDNQYYVIRDGKPHNITQGDDAPTATLYSLNQCLVAALDDVPPTVINRKIKVINRFLENSAKYYMLLNNELKYYTLFAKVQEQGDNFGKAVFECLEMFGNVKYIEIDEELGKAEIWTKDAQEPVAHVFYLFPYDAGVIEVNGN